MSKKAVIYVRTSTEHQGEKSSPAEQEADCRNFAAEHDITIVNVYKDITRFRVKNKLVDPSGTRSDRPGLLAMLEDATQGHFDMILAWREDRLYRGIRPMLIVLETIQEQNITVMLARETFDTKMAPLKAWLAQMELDGIKERMTMGVKARLRAGKANAGNDRYGYKRNGEIIEIVDEEAGWIRQIFTWYIERVSLLEIRKRLIEANAPQKGGPTPRRIKWNRNVIQQILGAANEYATGVKTQSRGGETFTISVEPIIDMTIYEAFLRVREANTNHPVRHNKHDYLIGGLLYCACNRKWGARTMTARRRDKNGDWKARKVQSGRYYCREIHDDQISSDCPRHIGSKKADIIVWEKVCRAINKPEILLAQARKMVYELQDNANALEIEQERIQRELDALAMERQWVITQARKGLISDTDMEIQLGAMSQQEMIFERELSSIEQAVNIQLLDDWEARVEEYLIDIKTGLESLNATSQGKEDQKEIFALKKQIVNTLVKKITIDRNRELQVEISINLLNLLSDDVHQRFKGKNKGQIKTAGILPGWRDSS